MAAVVIVVIGTHTYLLEPKNYGKKTCVNNMGLSLLPMYVPSTILMKRKLVPITRIEIVGIHQGRDPDVSQAARRGSWRVGGTDDGGGRVVVVAVAAVADQRRRYEGFGRWKEEPPSDR